MVSIKPFYNLCTKVMQSVGEPILLLKQNASPHDYQLKPSDVKLIESSDLIVWGGPELETYLQKPIANTTKNKSLNLATIPGLSLLPMRTSTNWEAEHDHAHEHGHEHSHDVNDPHFWLDPDNAIVMVKAIAARLSEIDPLHAKIYAHNAADFIKQLQKREPIWKKQLKSMDNKAFIVFHDAYQYLDHYFGLNGVGSITLNPEIPPSVQRIQQIQQLLRTQKVACIFSEPQFNYKIIDTLVNGLNIYTGKLDPLGQDTDIGPNGYFILIDNMVKSFDSCGNYSG
jgi:zinc transport system substrate-binding protein